MSILFWLVLVVQFVLLIFGCLVLKSFRRIERHIGMLCVRDERPKGRVVTLEQPEHPPDSGALPLNLTKEIVNEWFYGKETGKGDED